MAFYDTTWYVSSVGYAAVTVRPQNTAVAAGVVRRQFTAPSVGNERCFVCIVAGTTANVTDATWTLTRGAKTTDGTATWQECTGASAVNGDLTNTVNWTAAKAAGTPTLGAIIQRNSGASYQICSTAGTMGASEPSFSNTAGVTTNDGTSVWTSLGPVGNFSAWGAPHARLASAYASTWGAVGNRFFVADNHAETQATAMSLSPTGVASVGSVYTVCVDHTAALPPVEANYTTGATVSTTSNTSITFQFSSFVLNQYYQGISFSAGNGSTASAQLIFIGAAAFYSFKNCGFILGNSSTSSTINIGPGGTTPNHILWDNCTVQFAATGQFITLRSGNFEWRNTASAIAGATIPTALFSLAVGNSHYVVCRGVDLSAFNGQLLANNPADSAPLNFEDCKLHASVTRYGTSTTAGYSSAPVITVRCDTGATNYKSTRDEYAGTQITETSVTRVGGATDGTTATSDKITTNTQAQFLTPYRMLPLAIWNETTGADVTVTVYGTINSASLPTDAEIWMDIQYLGSSGSPVASFKTTAKSHPLATAANVASDGSSWNGGGSGAGWSPFKLVATLTSPQPQMKGFIYISVRAAKASTTWYIDPLPMLA